MHAVNVNKLSTKNYMNTKITIISPHNTDAKGRNRV
jgi:hypothetical protein